MKVFVVEYRMDWIIKVRRFCRGEFQYSCYSELRIIEVLRYTEALWNLRMPRTTASIVTKGRCHFQSKPSWVVGGGSTFLELYSKVKADLKYLQNIFANRSEAVVRGRTKKVFVKHNT
jgi:hypothetical protein